MPLGEVTDWFKTAVLKVGTIDARSDLVRLVARQTR
jgi:hypothetical protein